jgi:hypothetical protein
MTPLQKRSLWVGLGCTLATLFCVLGGYAEFGFITGAIGICATAPGWWQSTYLYGSGLLPLLAISAGIYGRRRYLRAKAQATF